MKNLDLQVLFSEFDQMFGPLPICSYPQIDDQIGKEISNKSMHFLSEKEYFNLSSLAIIPFPSEGKKGIAINIDWRNNNLRGGMGVGAFTLLFNQENDTIFYKYMRDLEPIFEEVVKDLVRLKTLTEENNDKNSEYSRIETVLKSIHDKFQEQLILLQRQETGIKENKEAFPVDSDELPSFIYKIIVCGDPGCGKTSIVLRYTDMAFRRTYIPTIGVNMSKKEVYLNGTRSALILWDVAGQAKFKSMRKQFYDGANAILFVFDLTRPETFNNIEAWFNDINNTIGNLAKRPKYLCGNKNDLEEQRGIKKEIGEDLASKLDMGYIETSALTGENVDNAFIEIIKKLKESTNN